MIYVLSLLLLKPAKLFAYYFITSRRLGNRNLIRLKQYINLVFRFLNMIAILKSRFLLLAAALTVLITFHVSAQEVKVIKYEGLEKLRQAPGDTLYIVNFWATWCGPCVKELPYFEAANQQYKDQPVKVILVSMDAVQDLDKKVTNFVKKRNLQSRLYLLDEVDGNSWIDKLEPKWTGAIPATIMFNNKRKQYVFFEGEMKEAQLQQLIQQHKP